MWIWQYYDIPATRDNAVKFEIFVECNGILIVAVALACSTYSTGTILLTSNSEHVCCAHVVAVTSKLDNVTLYAYESSASHESSVT